VTDNFPGLDILLSVEDHALARHFAAEQKSPAKGKRVYLNTLAVAALHTYLTWLNIESDLDSSYSLHPLQRSAFDRADLYIPDLGRLDCVITLPGETFAASPLASKDTIAQVLVQFSESLSSVRLVSYCLVIGEPEEEILTDFNEGWFEIEQLPETLILWQTGLDNLQSSNDERARRIQDLVNEGQLSWTAVLALSSSCWKEPYLLRSRLEDFQAVNTVTRMERPVASNLKRGEMISEDETLDQVENAMEGALDFLTDLWRSLE
jgi:hypothetical protein